MAHPLFQPFSLGSLELQNRIVMAPMTRSRANKNGEVTDMMVTYYEQRASAGLIIAEATSISAQGRSYPLTTGLFTKEQADSWKPLVEALHNKGGKIFIQLVHGGRISHPSLQPNNMAPVAPSPIKPDQQIMTYEGMKDFVVPHALSVSEIKEVVEDFEKSAILAKEVGFDGVEIHGANGYLLDQFLRDGTNQREDQYGGSLENRFRILAEILDKVCAVFDNGTTALRFSPQNAFNSMSDSDPETHFKYFIERLNAYDLSYIHILEGDMVGGQKEVNYQILKDCCEHVYMANHGFDREKAEMFIDEGRADLIAFGVPFIANPDLVKRLQENIEYNEPFPDAFYGGDEKGYIDYPFHGS